MSFIAELKRRNVIRMAGLYVVGAWLIVQVAETLLPIFEAPPWVVRTVVILLALGIVPVLVFSWVYELTPEGLKRDAEVPPAQSIAHVTGRRIDRAIIFVLLLALGYFAVDRFVFEPGRIERARAGASQLESPAARQAERSIVVLPFADMSPSKDQEYLSDGMAEELLNLLARIPELRVISRSSAFSFKGKAVDVATIAKQLDVAHVLEGSVRKAENQVRITVQLIDARNDAHLWSETYDRPLENIFAIQDEIAAAVVAQLKITLLGEAPKVEVTDPGAYALFLQGRELARIGSQESYARAVELFRQALAISPDYAQAWEALAYAHVNMAARGLIEVEEGMRVAREAANRALAIAPDLATAHGDLGWISNAYDQDLASSARHIERAFALDPGNSQVLFYATMLARSLGRIEQATALQERVLELDPTNAAAYAQLGKVYSFTGRDADALAAYRKAIATSPGYVGVRHWAVMVLLQGKPDRARAAEALALAKEEPDEAYRLLSLVLAHHALGQTAEADAALDEVSRRFESVAAYNVAYVHAYRGDADRTFEWLAKAAENDDGGLTELAYQPLFANLRGDPRWLPFLRSIRRAPEQLAPIAFDVSVPAVAP